MTAARIFVRFRVEGFHRWPAAPDHRGYLASEHRHCFHVEVSCENVHDDREIEFHDLLDYSKAVFPGGRMGAKTCEMMARELALLLASEFNRRFQCSVSEDGECGATVVFDPIGSDPAHNDAI